MPKQLDDCVKKLMQEGHDESSAYAICQSSIKENDKYKKEEEKKKKNEQAKPRRL